MISQVVDQNHYLDLALWIKDRVIAKLSEWYLPPKFNRWRLTQDPETGLIVLFAVLNSHYIAAHTYVPFSDYFDPRLLKDLANDLSLQVVSSNSGGLRYAFILDKGTFDKMPPSTELPILNDDGLLLHPVDDENLLPVSSEPQVVPVLSSIPDILQDQILLNQGSKASMYGFEDAYFNNKIYAELTVPEKPFIFNTNGTG